MSDRKIVGIREAKTGLQGLMEEANPIPQPQQSDSDFPKGKCLKLRCILEGVDYYVPDGVCGILKEEMPYFPWHFPVGYSVVMGAGPPPEPIAVIKHTEKRFYQTGISTEVVDLPKWWDKRDSY